MIKSYKWLWVAYSFFSGLRYLLISLFIEQSISYSYIFYVFLLKLFQTLVLEDVLENWKYDLENYTITHEVLAETFLEQEE